MLEQWSLQDAKARFSEFVRIVLDKGPHIVTLRGKPTVVVMSVKDYEAMNAQRPSLLKLMKSSPLSGMDLDVQRNGNAREFDL